MSNNVFAYLLLFCLGVSTVFCTDTCHCGMNNALTKKSTQDAKKNGLFFDTGRVLHYKNGSLELRELGLCVPSDLVIYSPGDYFACEDELCLKPAVQRVKSKLEVIVDTIFKRRAKNNEKLVLIRYHEPPGCWDYMVNYEAYKHPELDITNEAIETLNKAYLASKRKK